MTRTSTGAISLRMGGGVTGSVKMGISGWSPTMTISASGNISAAYTNVSLDHYSFGFDSLPPEGYNLVTSEKEKYFKDSDITSASLTFSVSLTLGGSSASTPPASASLTINLERHVLDIAGCYCHERIELISDPTVYYEHWSHAENGYVGSVITTGNGTSGLTTTVKENPSYSWGSELSSGTPPTPPEGPARTITAVLDAVQLGLDLAGMVPVAGEVCDLTNAIISAGRGNTGDAMLSLAATFPFGGQAATVGERVWAFDVINGEWQLHGVVRLFNRDYKGDSVFVSIDDDTIESTSRHPFWVVSGTDLETRPICDDLEPVPLDAATPGRWVDSGNLRVGDVLLLRDVST